MQHPHIFARRCFGLFYIRLQQFFIKFSSFSSKWLITFCLCIIHTYIYTLLLQSLSKFDAKLCNSLDILQIKLKQFRYLYYWMSLDVFFKAYSYLSLNSFTHHILSCPYPASPWSLLDLKIPVPGIFSVTSFFIFIRRATHLLMQWFGLMDWFGYIKHCFHPLTALKWWKKMKNTDKHTATYMKRKGYYTEKY